MQTLRTCSSKQQQYGRLRLGFGLGFWRGAGGSGVGSVRRATIRPSMGAVEAWFGIEESDNARDGFSCRFELF